MLTVDRTILNRHFGAHVYQSGMPRSRQGFSSPIRICEVIFKECTKVLCFSIGDLHRWEYTPRIARIARPQFQTPLEVRLCTGDTLQINIRLLSSQQLSSASWHDQKASTAQKGSIAGLAGQCQCIKGDRKVTFFLDSLPTARRGRRGSA